MSKRKTPREKPHITRERRDRFGWGTTEGLTITPAEQTQPTTPEQIPPKQRK